MAFDWWLIRNEIRRIWAKIRPCFGKDTTNSNPNHKCCCGLMHVTRGAAVIAVLGIIFHFLIFIRTCYDANVGENYTPMISVAFVVSILGTILAFLVLYGIGYIVPLWLIVYLVWLVLLILKSFMLVVISGMAINKKNSKLLTVLAEDLPEKQAKSWSSGKIRSFQMHDAQASLIINIINIGLGVFFVYIMYRAWRYIVDERKRMRAENQATQSLPQEVITETVEEETSGYDQPVSIEPLPEVKP